MMRASVCRQTRTDQLTRLLLRPLAQLSTRYMLNGTVLNSRSKKPSPCLLLRFGPFRTVQNTRIA